MSARSPRAAAQPPGIGRGRRAALIALEAFVGGGALYGGTMLLFDADGFGVRESWLQGSPFSDYTIPGLALLVLIGGGMLAAAALAARASRHMASAARAMALTVLAFLAVESAVTGYQGGRQLPLVATIAAAALAIVALAAPWSGRHPRARPRRRPPRSPSVRAG